MDPELRELYQEVIIEHSRSPHHFTEMAAATHSAEGFNPLCGDKVTVYLKIDNDTIVDISFQGCGCAISQASASMMTDALLNKPLTEAMRLFAYFHQVMLEPVGEPIDNEQLGKLMVLTGVREFPMRVKCATLAWHTMKNALDDKHEVANTEKEDA